jgi:poly(3-hydroxybutyrate) depolymerase
MTRRINPWWLSLPLLLVAFSAHAAKIRITVEAPGGLEQHVFLSRPVSLAPDRPVVFVMHGMKRNADEYRDQWHDLAEEHDFLLVVPEFRDQDFPDSEAYNLGNVFDGHGGRRPQTEWSFSAIERIFDDVRKRFGMTAEGYAMYGHSAGAQFVHRFLFHVPDARVTRAVAANAGWYAMPDFSIERPYGLRDSGVTREMLKEALQRPLTILLGEEDTEPEPPSLRRTQEALVQGAHRFARGQAFFAAGQAAARDLDVPFAWQLATVPEADHDNRLMAPAAIPYLLESESQ